MKKDYMARLERATRWRLPPQEAEDVIADYRDIVSNPPRTEEQLRREVGDPEQVVKLLMTSPKEYRIWLAVFAVMAACILIPANCPVPLFQPALIQSWLLSLNSMTTLHLHWVGDGLQWGGVAVGIVGVVGLVKARTRNRRWRAVYVLSFALMMMAFCLLNQYSFLDPSEGTAAFEAHIRQCCTVITIIGLAGTGVALI